MTERTAAALEALEREAGLAPGLLGTRFLPMFATDDRRLEAIRDADLPRLKAHVLDAVQGGPQRPVEAGTMLSPAEVQHFRNLLKRAGAAIAADPDLAPETVAAVRDLCPFCDADGAIEADPVDVAAPPSLPGTAGALRTDGG